MATCKTLLPAAISQLSKPDLEDAEIAGLRTVLTSETAPLAHRFRALFSLKHHASLSPSSAQTYPAIQAIAAAFSSPSALLKHELAYCLGQSKKLEATPYLRQVLQDQQEDAMCRHEAAEALGAIGDRDSLNLMKTLRDDMSQPIVVRETCEIAIARIEWEHSMSKVQNPENLKKSDFASVDPAPPMPQDDSSQHSVQALRQFLLDPSLPLFQRYRAMFALRDLASPPDLPTAIPAVQALAEGFGDKSALFRHEIAFVFGQLSHPESIPSLIKTLNNSEEEAMVRHEAAEALGSLGDEDGVEDVLRSFLDDPEKIVRDSVIVALDMAEFEKSGESEYAKIMEQPVQASSYEMIAKPIVSL